MFMLRNTILASVRDHLTWVRYGHLQRAKRKCQKMVKIAKRFLPFFASVELTLNNLNLKVKIKIVTLLIEMC